MNLTRQYDELYNQAIAGISAGTHHIDPLIDSPGDRRMGITLLIRPPLEIKQQIQLFLGELMQIDPDQYYYPISDIHITVLSIIGCYDGFNLNQISISEYEDRIQKVMEKAHPFIIQFSGVTASESCLMIPGFPENGHLNNLRDDLRSAFRQSNLQQSIDARYSIGTAHCTVVRFRKPLVDPNRYVGVIEKFRNITFGEFEVKYLELVFNDWYQRKGKTQLLKNFEMVKGQSG